MEKENLTRESITGRIIVSAIILVLITIIGISLLKISVDNIVYIDRGLYSVITSKGAVNITPEDILRIEHTYTKKALTGKPVELIKIYTKEGFIYFSSLDPFFEVGEQLISSVDNFGLTTWEHPTVDYKGIRPYIYSLGTPANQIPLISLLLSFQYLALTIGGIALIILVFPVRLQASAD